MKLLQEIIYHLTIKPKLNRLEALLPEASIYPCGSRYVCNPPVMFTDIDFLVYCENDLTKKLLSMGYDHIVFKFYHGNGADFISWRKGRINLIVTHNKGFTDNFNMATFVCRLNNIRRKYHRIIIHEMFRGSVDFSAIAKVELTPKLCGLVENLTGPHATAMRAIYKIQYGGGSDGQ